MKKRLDTYCGLYCGGCEIFQANEKGKVEEKAKEWEMDQPTDLVCNGCKTEVVSLFCRECKIKECAQAKEVEFCYQCTEFPCQRLLDFKNDQSPHHSVVMKNISEIKEKGIEQWLEDQAKRWSCVECSENFSWYEDECSKCGTPLRNAVLEEKELG